MNSLTKKLALSATALAGVVSLGAGVLSVSAAQATGEKADRMSGLVTALAQKFHLNVTDVQQVFDQQHQEMHVQMQAKHAEHMKTFLDQAVKAGKLTQAQEDLIIAKHKELQAAREALKAKTPEERQAAMKTEQEALAQWAKANNIPVEYLKMGMGQIMKKGEMKSKMNGKMKGGRGSAGWGEMRAFKQI